MDFRVGKFGFQGFDSVHALGFGIIITCATEQPVRLRDRGVDYMVRSPVETLPASLDLDQVIPLPTTEQILAFSATPTKPIPLPIVILDGILATQFTSPTGARVISVADLLYKLKQDPEIVENALKKAHLARQQLEKFITRSSEWLRDAIGDYAPENLQMPLLAPTNRKNGLSVVMTIDPSFTFSAHRTLSDGLIGMACNYSVQHPQYAPLFARIGAARFLHAQRVAGNLANFYMPLIGDEIELTPETRWKIFPNLPIPSKQSVLVTMLNLLRDGTSSNLHTDQFTYQVLQMQQKGKQSISAGRGLCSADWVKPFQQRVGPGLTERWRTLLRLEQGEIDIDLHKLMEFVERPSAATWFDHLEDITNYWHAHSSPRVRPYTVEEVREISNMNNPNPLSDIFSREKGTLRFGRALRLLGNNYNRSALRDITAELRSVSTIEDLFTALDLANQRFATAFAKTDFIIIPDDKDSEQLMRDVEMHGVPIIARLLILLSSLRFDRVNDDAKDETNETSGKRGVSYYDEDNSVADRLCIQVEDSLPGTPFE